LEKEATSGQVRICVDDLPVEKPDKLIQVLSDGTFTSESLDVKPGNVIFAQSVGSVRVSKASTSEESNEASKSKVSVPKDTSKTAYSVPSKQISVGPCSSVQIGSSSTRPTLDEIKDSRSFKGRRPGAKRGTEVRICVDDSQDAAVVVDDNGAFYGLFSQPVKPNHSVTAQEITSGPNTFPVTYGLVSPERKLDAFAYSGLFATFIAGVEQSGYSSQITNTNFFLNAQIRSEYFPQHSEGPGPFAPGFALWGRTRLLSAPQPSTNNIVSVLTDPTGQISQSGFSKVGQVIDYVIGPELRLWQWDRPDQQTTRISLIAAVGATTPLGSDTVTLTYNAPGPNTPECAALINRYPPNLSRGIAGLYPGPAGADGLQTTCIINPVTKTAYKYVVFTNQNRSNFLGKYGGGVRLKNVYPAKGKGSPYAGWLDLVFGQDESITGGTFHGTVFKIDGQYPFAYGPLSFIYFFGSASMRLNGNQNYSPLILTVPTGNTTPTVPSADVTVLSTQQPNRDFYRIGIGLNLLDIFSKLKSGPTTGNANPASATSESPATAAPSKPSAAPKSQPPAAGQSH
jgi:hypothetical protein